jgi:hypothetical protein
MSAYPPVPARWYIITLVGTLTATVILIETTPLQMPLWALTLAVFIALVRKATESPRATRFDTLLGFLGSCWHNRCGIRHRHWFDSVFLYVLRESEHLFQITGLNIITEFVAGYLMVCHLFPGWDNPHSF